jgi:hypothetical protein
MNIAIPIGFLILAVILLWFFINTKGKLGIKVILTLLAGYYSLVTWCSLGTYAGWATDQELPEQFIVHWVTVEEPNKKTNDPGAIYIWITSPDLGTSNMLNFLGYKPEKPEPRIYKLPYSISMHEKAEKIRGLLKKGKVVKGGKKKGKPGEGDAEGDEGKGQPNSSGGRPGRPSMSNKQDYEFYELLPSVLPDKYRDSEGD